jgi:predicted DNA-binding transcriptional regulator AlpA
MCSHFGVVFDKKDHLPRSVSLGGRAAGWVEAAEDPWLNRQIKALRQTGH